MVSCLENCIGYNVKELPTVKQLSGQPGGGTAEAGWHRRGSLQFSYSI